MRRLVAWVGGVVGGIAAYRLVRRSQEASRPVSSAADERAEELRAKLAESKLTESRAPEDTVEDTPAEPATWEEPEPALGGPDSPEERRLQVHEEGRAALDEMKSDDAGG